MAKKSLIESNNRKKYIVKKCSAQRADLKAKIMDRDLPLEERIVLVRRLSEMPRNGSSTRVRNRCELTGRPRGYYRKFGISRIALREHGSEGLIPGLVKSSW